MQPHNSSTDGGGSRARPPAAVPIPGARQPPAAAAADDASWPVNIRVGSASFADSASVGMPTSMGDVLFGSSLRRNSTADYGYASSHGHGAWLSGSLGNTGALGRTPTRPPLHRSPSLARQPSAGGLASHEEGHKQSAAAAASAAAEAGLGAGPMRLGFGGGVAAVTRRASLDAPAPAASLSEASRAQRGGSPPPLSPRRNSMDLPRRTSSDHSQHRPQRWHLGANHTDASSTLGEALEPLLSGELSESAFPLPTSPLGKPAAAGAADPVTPVAAAAGAAVQDGAGVGGPQVAMDPRLAEEGGTDISRALVFGMINTIATVPTLVAYCAIVFKDPIYAPYIDQLCKFFFLSSALHQAVFCLLSTLPFSVGQVQDVGLIFLSAMATSVAGICLEAGKDADTALGTSLLTMSVATFFTGAMTLLVAYFKLAQLVQYLPLPVIGGYLSFVGYFCVASGIGLGVSQDIGSIASWVNLFHVDSLIKLIPTAGSCLAMILTLEHFSHPLALPTVMVGINLLFHVVRLAMGVTLEQAMDADWVIRPAEGQQNFWELWGLFNIRDLSLSGIYFPAMSEQVVKMVGLALVVIFGSAMDIAAIQQDTPKKIDFNRELATVAVSNMATGVAGCGYTGSYIFSQTIFTMRAGVYSRWNGWVVAISEAVMFALPFPVIQYCPNFFFGALLLWFGIEISRDWLLLSFTKMTRTEYGLLLCTFAAIMQWGLEGGIAAGIVMATLYFAAAYAKSQVAAIDPSDTARSSVVRTVEQQAALDMLAGRLACINLNGFVFFGSANTIGQRLQEEAERLGGSRDAEVASARLEQAAAEVEEAIVTSLRTMGESYVGVKHTQAVAALAAAPAYLVLDFSHVRGLDATGARTMGVVHSDLAQHGVVLVITAADHHGIRPLLLAHGVPLPPEPQHWPREMAQPHVEDLPGSIRGSQAGSPRARAGSLAAEQPWESERYPEEALGGMAPTCLEFNTLEQGLRYCEDQLLEVAVRYGLCQPPSALMPLEDMLASHLLKMPLGGLDPLGVAQALRRYMSVVSLSAGQLLWKVDDPANELFIIEKGSVRVDEFVHISPLGHDGERPVGKEGASSGNSGSGGGGGGGGGTAHAAGTAGGGGGGVGRLSASSSEVLQARRASALASASAASLPDRMGSGHRVLTRSYELGPGCVVGSTDFYLARPHGTRAVCRSAVARVLRVTRPAMERMASEIPQALNVLQLAVMRANTLDLAQAAAQVQGGAS